MAKDNPVKGISKAWIDQIESSRKAKTRFTSNADECMRFYTGAYDHIYDGTEGVGKIYRGKLAPKFRVSMNLASDFVRIYTPYLINQSPTKVVTPYTPEDYDQALFTSLGEQAQQAYQQAMMAEQERRAVNIARAQVMEKSLNYFANEGPGGSYRYQIVKSVQESLLKGRGVFLTQPYVKNGFVFPTTTAITPDRLFYDPDVDDYREAKWMALEFTEPTWQVENEWGLPKDTLSRPNTSGGEPDGVQTYGEDENRKAQIGKTNDLTRYYIVWSKMGVGHRLAGGNYEDKKVLDKLGRNVFMVITEDCEYPLNLHPDVVKKLSYEQLKERLRWVGGLDIDDSWPISILDYDTMPGDSWPVSPLEPGIGILKAINVVVSHLVTRTWKSSRDLILTFKALEDDVKSWFQSGNDLDVFGLPALNQADIRSLIHVFQHPPVNKDQTYILEFLIDTYRRTTGITDLQYGIMDHQTRVAAEMQGRMSMVKNRPEWMKTCVEECLGEVVRKEAMIAHQYTKAEAVLPLLGPTGAYVWQNYVENGDRTDIARELEYRVAAGSTARPDKDKQTANLREFMQYGWPVLHDYAARTSDPGPLNAVIDAFGDTIDLDTTEFKMQQWTPPPPPPGTPNPAEQQMQLEQAKTQAELQRKNAELQIKLKSAEETHRQKMAQAQESHRQKLLEAQDRHSQNIGQRGESHEVEVVQNEEVHAQDYRQDEESFEQEYSQNEQAFQQELEMAKKMAQQQPRKDSE